MSREQHRAGVPVALERRYLHPDRAARAVDLYLGAVRAFRAYERALEAFVSFALAAGYPERLVRRLRRGGD